MVRLWILFLRCTVISIPKTQIFVKRNAISYPDVIPVYTVKYAFFSIRHFIYELQDASTLADYLNNSERAIIVTITF